MFSQGCLVIFFTNFLALMVKAEVAESDSNGSTLYAVALVIVNVLLFLSVFWNIWASTEAMFSDTQVLFLAPETCLFQGRGVKVLALPTDDLGLGSSLMGCLFRALQLATVMALGGPRGPQASSSASRFSAARVPITFWGKPCDAIQSSPWTVSSRP